MAPAKGAGPLRKERVYELREELRRRPELPVRTRHCGVTRYQKRVQLVTAGGTAWWAGVVCCRARVCPTCHVARRFKLAREVEHVVLERETETRAQSYLATLTVRHSAEDPVSITRDVRKAWRLVLQSRAWQRLRAEHQLEWIAAEEVTHGKNGYHPHVHALLMPRKPLAQWDEPTDEQGERVASWLYDTGVAGRYHAEVVLAEQWKRAVARAMGPGHEPSGAHGVDFSECDAPGYLTKIGLELTDPSVVKGSSALELLASGHVDRYLELQLSRTRARDLTFSRGLRAIRESQPSTGEVAELAELSGTEWGRIVHRAGWRGPLAIAMASRDPESAHAAIREVVHHGRLPNPARRDDETGAAARPATPVSPLDL